MSASGFILQPTYRIIGERAVVHLYGVLEDGSPCLIRDDRFLPHFYIRAEDGPRAQELGARQQVECDRSSMQGEPLLRVQLNYPADTPALRNRLLAARIPCYEADLPFALLYLMDRGIKGGFRVEGDVQEDPRLGLVWSNPRLEPARVAPKLRVLSVDIETDPHARRLLSIALYGEGIAEVLLLAPPKREAPPPACTPFGSEKELLAAFAERVRSYDPDALTGWNVVDFDLTVLDRLARKAGTPLHLGRDSGPLRLRRARSPWSSQEAVIPGRLVLDGIDLLRSSFIRMEEYSLDFVAGQVLGEGKTLQGGGPAQILETYHGDLPRFVEYNLTDARLALQILERLEVFPLAVERSLLTGLPPNRVGASIASFDFLYLTELHRQGRVAHSVGRVDPLPPSSNEGGHVLEPVPGLYSNVVVFDFKSLYPSVIRTFQIDPLGHAQAGEDEDAIRAPNGARFRRVEGILPRLLGELFPRRAAARQRGDEITSHAIKILMNSFYGVLGTTACRFYHPELAGAITGFGRLLLLWSKQRLEDWGFEVLYGDTDSLFVRSGEADAREASARGRELAARLNQALRHYTREKWNVESHLELEFERVYSQLHFPAVRHGSAGARKRYAGIIELEGEQQIRFVGMEVVRRDWTELAKQVQRELYHRLFHRLPQHDYLRDLVVRLKAGELDDWLVYRKGIRKNLADYTATTPPHIAAARKLPDPPDFGTISYLMTTAGPEPLEQRHSPIDYNHYIQRQLRPVAVPILELSGLDFSELIGESYQLRLFDRM